MKEILKSTGIGIGVAAFFFCIAGIIFDIIYGGSFSLEDYGFTKMVLGCLVVGIGFGVPSIIYEKEYIPRPFQMVIHMGIGCVVYTIVAFAVGWIPVELGVAKCILILAAQIAVAFIVWLFFLGYYRSEARKINEKIRKLK